MEETKPERLERYRTYDKVVDQMLEAVKSMDVDTLSLDQRSKLEAKLSQIHDVMAVRRLIEWCNLGESPYDQADDRAGVRHKLIEELHMELFDWEATDDSLTIAERQKLTGELQGLHDTLVSKGLVVRCVPHRSPQNP